VGPGALAARRADLSMRAFVRETFFDGCIGETRAALEPRSRDGDSVERAFFEGMADDERVTQSSRGECSRGRCVRATRRATCFARSL
jgi:hypothetical protein